MTTTTALRIARLDPADDAALNAYYDLAVAAQAADHPYDPPPCKVDWVGRVRYPWPGEDEEVWLGSVDDRVVGAYRLSFPTMDNPNMAFAELVVHPAERGRGHGRALMAAAQDGVRRSARRLFVFESCLADPAGVEPPGTRFARATGAHLALATTRRRQDLDAIAPETLERLRAGAEERAAGYSLVRWRGSTPEEYVEDMAALTARMSTDAPMDDLALEPEHFDADRIRGRDASCRLRGLRQYTTIARHDATGAVVGFTQLTLFASHDHYGDQWDTIVVPEHRGHRLGLLLKLENLAWTRAYEPALRIVDTWNADSNPWMVGVNEAMGYRPLDRWAEWQLEL